MAYIPWGNDRLWEAPQLFAVRYPDTDVRQVFSTLFGDGENGSWPNLSRFFLIVREYTQARVHAQGFFMATRPDGHEVPVGREVRFEILSKGIWVYAVRGNRVSARNFAARMADRLEAAGFACERDYAWKDEGEQPPEQSRVAFNLESAPTSEEAEWHLPGEESGA